MSRLPVEKDGGEILFSYKLMVDGIVKHNFWFMMVMRITSETILIYVTINEMASFVCNCLVSLASSCQRNYPYRVLYKCSFLYPLLLRAKSLWGRGCCQCQLDMIDFSMSAFTRFNFSIHGCR